MDSIFLLSAEARALLFQSTALTVGSSYICLWSYLPQPSNCLISLDGWIHEDATSTSRMLFDSYRASLISVGSGCVPGLFKDAPSYLELVDSELVLLASLEVQRRFYQEAGIKRAVFMGCKNGEMEIGMSSPTAMFDLKLIQQLLCIDFLQQFQIPNQTHLAASSSSSSLKSLSIGSPDYSSLFPNKPYASSQPVSVFVHPHEMEMSAYRRQQNLRFPTPASDDAALMRAFLTVMSSSTPSSSTSPFIYQSKTSRHLSAFKPYHSNILGSNIGSETTFTDGQRMIKKGISMLTRIYLMRAELHRIRESQPSFKNQIHHTMAERKRRMKLNESFNALRLLLPPGSKKDKASVLLNTRNYIDELKEQIFQLKEKNKLLEEQNSITNEIATQEAGGPKERIQVEIVPRFSESTSEMLPINLRVRVTQDCNMIDLLLCILGCLKGDGYVILASINAISHTRLRVILATLSLHVKASDWNEESLKRAVTQAVVDFVTALPAATNL